MRAAMYIFANKGLGMSPGKMSAQVAHAAVEAFRISNPSLIHEWYVGGHYCKYVMAAEDEMHLYTIKHYLEERGFNTKLIVDEGHTEIRPHTVTALGVEIVDKHDPHTAATFSDFKTYREVKERPMKTIGWEWAFGTTVHYLRWGGRGKHGFSSISGGDFQIAFNPIKE